jgi:ribosomal protein L9
VFLILTEDIGFNDKNDVIQVEQRFMNNFKILNRSEIRKKNQSIMYN